MSHTVIFFGKQRVRMIYNSTLKHHGDTQVLSFLYDQLLFALMVQLLIVKIPPSLYSAFSELCSHVKYTIVLEDNQFNVPLYLRHKLKIICITEIVLQSHRCIFDFHLFQLSISFLNAWKFQYFHVIYTCMLL